MLNNIVKTIQSIIYRFFWDRAKQLDGIKLLDVMMRVEHQTGRVPERLCITHTYHTRWEWKEGRPYLKIAYKTTREVHLPDRLSEGIWTGGVHKFSLCMWRA